MRPPLPTLPALAAHAALAALSLLAAAGAVHAADPAAGEPTTPLPPPVTLTLTGPEKVAAPGVIDLVLRIERTVPTAVPIDVALELPRDVRLVAGKLRERIVDARKQVIERTYRVRVARVPKEDLRAVVDVRAAVYGVHGVATYRFGRPEPQLAVPPTRVVHGPHGVRLARPIVVTPATPPPKGP